MTFGLGLSPLGTYGLGVGSGFGDYSSYMPSTMGMYGMGGFGMPGMYGMYGMGGMGSIFEYQKYLHQMQNEIELNRLNHTAAMHNGMINNEVLAHEDTFSGIVRKLMTDGDIQQRIMTLNRKIKEGDQDGVCQEYDRLKDRVYNECYKEFEEKGIKGNRADLANQIIESIYGNIVSAREGQTHSLHEDITRYGDGAFLNGFLKGLRRDHHGKYVDETLNHIYGERIDHRSEKDARQTLGKGIGRGVSVLESGVIGAGLGAGTYITGLGITTGVGKLFRGSNMSAGNFFVKGMKGTKWGLAFGAIASIAWNIYRQCTEGSRSRAAA